MILVKIKICCKEISYAIDRDEDQYAPSIRTNNYGKPILYCSESDLDKYPIAFCPWCGSVIEIISFEEDEEVFDN